MSKRLLDTNKNDEQVLKKTKMSLPKLKSKEEQEQQIQEKIENDRCAICMEPLNDGRPLKYCDSVSHIPTKENPRAHVHIFHKECINAWLRGNNKDNNSCPECGSQILCLDPDKYIEEIVNAPDPLRYNQDPDNYDPDDIPSEDENMDTEPTDNEGVDIDIDTWNREHPRGPWWRIITCETPSQNCPYNENYPDQQGKNFQWFLSHEPEDVELTDAAQASGWESMDGNKICPDCAEDSDTRDYCEHCEEGYFFPEDNLTHVDDELLCDDCMERAGINPETGVDTHGNTRETGSYMTTTTRVGGREKTRRKTKKAKKAKKTKVKKTLKLTKTRFKSPTTLSIFPEKSPQLQHDEPSMLNAFTTKNVQIVDKNHQVWNSVENGKLAYKRSARGAHVGNFPKIIYGSHVERLTKNNYKQLTKDTEVYYDRSSVVFRGPFIYQKTLRGPNLVFTVKDVGYLNKTYKFTIPVSKLSKEILYFAKKGAKSSKKKSIKHNKPKKRKKTLKHKKRRNKSKK